MTRLTNKIHSLDPPSLVIILLNFKVAKGTKETTFHASFCWFLLKISVVLCSSCPVHPFFSIFGSAISFGNFALQNVSSAFNFSISIEQHFVVQMKCAQFETWTMHLMLCVFIWANTQIQFGIWKRCEQTRDGATRRLSIRTGFSAHRLRPNLKGEKSLLLHSLEQRRRKATAQAHSLHSFNSICNLVFF